MILVVMTIMIMAANIVEHYVLGIALISTLDIRAVLANNILMS